MATGLCAHLLEPVNADVSAGFERRISTISWSISVLRIRLVAVWLRFEGPFYANSDVVCLIG